MALQLLELPNHTIISRRFVPRNPEMDLHGTVHRLSVPFHYIFGTGHQVVVYHVMRKRLMSYAFTGFSNIVEPSSGHGFYKCLVVNEAGTPVSDKDLVQIIAEVPKYVCRAGHRLEAAIEQLGIDVSGKVALDSGLSTGGFTDCLLQYGHAAMVSVMKEEATLVTLVKPQTEARRSQVGSGGIVSDPLVHQEVLDRIVKVVENFGFSSKGRIESLLKGCSGQYRISRSLLRQLREVRMKKC